MDDEEIKAAQEEIVARRAWLDQRKKQFEDQYPHFRPQVNKQRLEDLEAWEFEIEIDEWELQQRIDSE